MLFARVPEDMPLYDILNEFQKGHSHMAVVIKQNDPREQHPMKIVDGGKFTSNPRPQTFSVLQLIGNLHFATLIRGPVIHMFRR